jgi:di/tricarboxylate transporter
MTFGIAAVLVITVLTIIMFALDRWPMDLVALGIVAAIIVTGVLPPARAVAGFSNPATVTVTAMFVLSAALTRSGAADAARPLFHRLAARGEAVTILGTMIVVGSISAFMNNTAAVIVFLPVLMATAADSDLSRSRLLMPLSFAGMLGGSCTLIGTSTNILVSDVATRAGAAPIGMFELVPVAVPLFVVGAVYLLGAGRHLLPRTSDPPDRTEEYDLAPYLVEVRLAELPDVGEPPTLGDLDLVRDEELQVLAVVRDGERLALPPPHFRLHPHDTLLLRGDAERIARLRTRKEMGWDVRTRTDWKTGDLETEDVALVEVIVSPSSPWIGQRVRNVSLVEPDPVSILAVRHRGALLRQPLADVQIRAGDMMLLELPLHRIPALTRSRTFAAVSRVEVRPLRRLRMAMSLVVLAGVVAVAATNVLPIVGSALVGCVLLVATRCLTLEEAYEAIEWPIVFLLAGVLGLGEALRSTGAAELIASGLVDVLAPWGDTALLAGFFLLTALLTSFISNNATAALLAPLAIATGESTGVDGRPLLMAVVFGASAAFASPIGYQTNLLVLGPGRYTFGDFLRVGAPLVLLFALVTVLLVPQVWPFRPGG